jgi:hypothetical protein
MNGVNQGGATTHEGDAPTADGRLLELRHRLARSDWPVVLLLVLIIAGLGAHGVGLGLSSHSDSRAIVEKSIPAILHGSYVPSRSLGVPLYEVVGALLYRATGSLTAVNWYSLVLAIASLFIFAGLLDRSLSVARRSLVLVGFALNPLVLINSSAVIEWMQMTFLLVILLASAKAWLEHRRTRDLLVYGLSSALLVLTRPDAALLCVALLIALLWETRFASISAVPLIVSNLVAGLATATVFVVINHGIDFVAQGNLPSTDPLLRRFGVATMDAINVFGPLGIIVIAFLAFNLVTSLVRDRTPISWWGRLLLVTAPLFIARFVLMPDKLEYVLPLVVVVLLAVAHERLSLTGVAVVAFSLIIPSAICVSLFKRTNGTDRFTVAIHANRGALAQEWEATRYDRLLTSRPFLDNLADLVYAGESPPRPQLRINEIGVVSGENDLIVGEEQLYRLDNERFTSLKSKRKAYRRIYICDGSIIGFFPGWRVLQRPPTLPPIDPMTGQFVLRCWQEGPLGIGS